MSNVQRAPQDLREVKGIRSDSSEMQNMKATVSQKETQTSCGSISESLDSVSTNTNSCKAPPAKKDDHVFKVPALPSRKKDDHVFKVPAVPLGKKTDLKAPQAPVVEVATGDSSKPSVSSCWGYDDHSPIQVSPYPPYPPYHPYRLSTRLSRAPTVQCINPYASFITEMIENPSLDDDEFSIVSSPSDSEETFVSNLDSLPKAENYNYDRDLRPPSRNQFRAPEEVDTANSNSANVCSDALSVPSSVTECPSANPVAEPKDDSMVDDFFDALTFDDIVLDDANAPGNTYTAGPQDVLVTNNMEPKEPKKPNANTSCAKARPASSSLFKRPSAFPSNLDPLACEFLEALYTDLDELGDVNAPGNSSTAGPQDTSGANIEESNMITSSINVCSNSLSSSSWVAESPIAIPIAKPEDRIKLRRGSTEIASEGNQSHRGDHFDDRERRFDGHDRSSSRDIYRHRRRSMSPDSRSDSYHSRYRSRSRNHSNSASSKELNVITSSVNTCSGALSASSSVAESPCANPVADLKNDAIMKDTTSDDIELYDPNTPGNTSTAGPQDASGANIEESNAITSSVDACSDALSSSSWVAESPSASRIAKPKDRAKLRRGSSELASEDNQSHRGDHFDDRERRFDGRGRNSSRDSHRRRRRSMSPDRKSDRYNLRSRSRSRNHSSSTSSKELNACSGAPSLSSSVAGSSNATPTAKPKDSTKIKRVAKVVIYDYVEMDDLNAPESAPTAVSKHVNSTNTKARNANTSNTEACNDTLLSSSSIAKSSIVTRIAKAKKNAKTKEIRGALAYQDNELRHVNKKNTNTKAPNANTESDKACNDALSPSSSVAESSKTVLIAKQRMTSRKKASQARSPLKTLNRIM